MHSYSKDWIVSASWKKWTRKHKLEEINDTVKHQLNIWYVSEKSLFSFLNAAKQDCTFTFELGKKNKFFMRNSTPVFSKSNPSVTFSVVKCANEYITITIKLVCSSGTKDITLKEQMICSLSLNLYYETFTNKVHYPFTLRKWYLS